MTPRISLNAEQVTLDDVWLHYEALRAAVIREAETARNCLAHATPPGNPHLFGMDREEMDAYFENLFEEIDAQTSLFLLAATEATIRADFLTRVYQRKKDVVSRTFRNVYNSCCDHDKVKVRLEQDILDVWGEQLPAAKSDVGRLKGAFKYRHWLAHGRYWVPRFGQRYDPSGLVQIASGFFITTGVASN